jgi:hypothetical protein
MTKKKRKRKERKKEKYQMSEIGGNASEIDRGKKEGGEREREREFNVSEQNWKMDLFSNSHTLYLLCCAMSCCLRVYVGF